MGQLKTFMSKLTEKGMSNLMIVLGLFVTMWIILVRLQMFQTELQKECFLIVGMIIGGLLTFLNHPTPPTDRQSVPIQTDTVESITVNSTPSVEESRVPPEVGINEGVGETAEDAEARIRNSISG